MRTEWIERMTKIYGADHELTLQFIELCERYEENDWNNTVLKTLVKCHEQFPVNG